VRTGVAGGRRETSAWLCECVCECVCVSFSVDRLMLQKECVYLRAAAAGEWSMVGIAGC
jgi:hypothetical protein